MERPPRPKRAGRYHHGDLRRALLDAALELIEEEGVSAVTTRSLARRLGVSHAAPAHHFKDREALLVQVAAEGFKAFADALHGAAASDAAPEERLVAIGRAYVRFAVEHPSYLRVMFGRGLREGVMPPRPVKQEGERAFQVLLDAVAGLDERARAGERVLEAAIFAWSLVHGLATLWIDGPARSVVPTKASLDALAERMILGAIPGLRSRLRA